jgi:hypothetical protein
VAEAAQRRAIVLVSCVNTKRSASIAGQGYSERNASMRPGERVGRAG